MRGCAYDRECQNIPTYRIDVHWTLADFMGAEVCTEHLGVTVKYFQRRRVEGFSPAISAYALFDDEDLPPVA